MEWYHIMYHICDLRRSFNVVACAHFCLLSRATFDRTSVLDAQELVSYAMWPCRPFYIVSVNIVSPQPSLLLSSSHRHETYFTAHCHATTCTLISVQQSYNWA